MQTRIYVVTEAAGQGIVQRLVEATSAAQAVNHCVKPRFSATVAASKDVAFHMGHGRKIEHANEQPMSAKPLTNY